MDDTVLEVPESVLGRLLQELSWEGSRINRYRQGGKGYENVLTAEALTALDFLPRTAFLGSVLAAAHGADLARAKVIGEVEEAQITLLPGDIILAPSKASRGERLIVQPDGILTSPECFVLIEAKRIRSSAFQPEQLAREYVSVLLEAARKTPLLLLILGDEPPVKVSGAGRLPIASAIELHLASVLERADQNHLELELLLDRIPQTVAWITWHELGQVIRAQQLQFDGAKPSITAAINRLADSTLHAIARHS